MGDEDYDVSTTHRSQRRDEHGAPKRMRTVKAWPEVDRDQVSSQATPPRRQKVSALSHPRRQRKGALVNAPAQQRQKVTLARDLREKQRSRRLRIAASRH